MRGVSLPHRGRWRPAGPTEGVKGAIRVRERIEAPRRGRLRAIGAALAAGVAAFALRGPLIKVGGLILGAALACFLLAPLARFYERRLSRPIAALACLFTVLAAGAGLAWLLLPAMLRELSELARALPRSIGLLSEWSSGARGWLEGHLPGVALPEVNLTDMQGALSGFVSGSIAALSNLASAVGRISMAAVLAYFFLCDRENLMLRLELLLPRSVRPTAIPMAAAVGRELRLYLRGQLMIAGVVGALSALALALVGVRSALVLGPVIGLFNMIPYFGPYIGGLPAVLIALGDGWQRAAMAAAALAVVQQLDASWISPKIMGSLTGFSPTLVLVGLYAGACVSGVGGMLFALPVMMAMRTLFRVFVQKCENI